VRLRSELRARDAEPEWDPPGRAAERQDDETGDVRLRRRGIGGGGDVDPSRNGHCRRDADIYAGRAALEGHRRRPRARDAARVGERDGPREIARADAVTPI